MVADRSQHVVFLRAPKPAQWSPIRATAFPSNLLFRTGGDTTVRGYSFDSLGVAAGFRPMVGGRYYTAASVEVTRWIGENWGTRDVRRRRQRNRFAT